MRRSPIRGAAIAVAAAVLLVGCTATSTSVAKTKPLNLIIGSLLPQTGQFAALEPAENAGITLAADDINKAGLGVTVTIVDEDSGDATTKTAATSVKALIAKHATAIVGPSSNDVTAAVLGQATSAGLVMISPQNSSPDFSRDKDHGLYFRTSPSDDAEGTELGSLIGRDGARTLGMIVLADDYGTAVQKTIATSFRRAGGTAVTTQTFPATATDLTSQVAAIVKAKPDAVALVTQSQATTIAPALIAAGIPAKDLYFTDRDLLQYGVSMPVALTGAKGVAPGPVLDGFFQQKLLVIDPTLTTFAYAPESYDAVALLALAALAADSTRGSSIAANLRAVSGGSVHGEKATDFASAAQIVLARGAVDYDGYSGGIAFDANGDPTQAVFGVFQYGAGNQFTRITSLIG